MADVDQAVLSEVGRVLTPDLVDDVITRVRELMAPAHRDTRRERLEQQITEAKQQGHNLAKAVALGGDIPALVAELRKAERTHQEFVRALNALEDEPKVVRIDWRATERQARRLMANWRGLLTRNVQEARQVLTSLLEKPIIFTPILDETHRGYRFEGALATGAILFGNLCGNEAGVPGQN